MHSLGSKKKKVSSADRKSDEVAEGLETGCGIGHTENKLQSSQVWEAPPSIIASKDLREEEPVQVLPATAATYSARKPIIRCKYHNGVIEDKVCQSFRRI
jgi:hypothetical protein